MFTMIIELMCPDGREDEPVGIILKLADTVEVGNGKRRSNAIKGVRRARTEEVEYDTPHYSNEQDEVCNETFSCFNFILTALFNAGSFTGKRSILGAHSKN